MAYSLSLLKWGNRSLCVMKFKVDSIIIDFLYTVLFCFYFFQLYQHNKLIKDYIKSFISFFDDMFESITEITTAIATPTEPLQVIEANDT